MSARRARAERIRPLTPFRFLVLGVLSAVLLPARAAAPGTPAEDPTLRRGDAYYHLMRARLALGDGKGADAAAEIAEAVALLPDSAPLLEQGASLLAAAGRRGDAERMAHRALEIDDRSWTATRVLADLAATRAFGAQGDAAARAEAIRLYEKIAAGDPAAGPEVFGALTRLKLQSGDPDGAVAAARKFLARRPGDDVAIRLLVQALVADDKLELASHEALDWLKANPQEPELLAPAADLARKAGAWQRLEAASAALLEANPGDDRLRGYHGEALLRLGRTTEATLELEGARAAVPDDVMIRVNLVAAYNASNRVADGVALARELTSEYPDNPGIRSLLAEGLARQGDGLGAIAAFSAALHSIAGKDASAAERRDDLRQRIAALYVSRKETAEATRILDGAETPEDADALELRARIAIAESRFGDARSVASKLGEKGEPGAQAALEGEVLAAEKKFDAARARLGDAAGILGPGFRGQAAEILRRAGDAEGAEALLREWVKSEPGSADARFRLGAFLEREKRYPEADAELRESIRLRPEFGDALNYLGYSLADRNERLDEAESLIKRALGADPGNGAFLDSLGWVCFRKGRYAEAREHLERAVREYPNDGTVLEHLGDTLEKLGDKDRARQAYKLAVEAGGDNLDSVRRKLGERGAAPTPRP